MASVNEAFEMTTDPSSPPSSLPATVNLKDLESPKRRKFQRGAVDFVSNVGAFFEQRLKIRHAQTRLLRAVIAIPAFFNELFASSNNVAFAKTRISDSNVLCRVYRPVEPPRKTTGKYSLSNRLPGCIVYLHGTGFVFAKNAASYHSTLTDLCLQTRSVVIAPEFRIPFENQCIAGLDDCCAVVRSLLDDEPIEVHLQDLAFDSSRVVVAGDCSGGTLAISVALDLIRRPASRRLHAIAAVCPPLQAITTKPFYSSLQIGSKLSFRPDWSLPRMAGISPVPAELRHLIDSDTHLPREMWLKLIEKVLPSQRVDERPVENQTVPSQLIDLVTNSRLWPLLADVEDLVQLSSILLMSCDHDPLLLEQKVFSDRLQLLIGDRVRFILVERALHCDPINPKTAGTEASRQSYGQFVAFLKEMMAAKPSAGAPMSHPSLFAISEAGEASTTETGVVEVTMEVADVDDVFPRVYA